MKLKIILFVLFVGLFTLSGCKTKQSSIAILNGTWEGEAYQFDVNEKWSISLLCNMKKRGYIIYYPSLGCGGKWILEEHSDNRFQFREVLNEGLDICTNKGKVELVLKDQNTISFSYYWPTDEVLLATGYLYREHRK